MIEGLTIFAIVAAPVIGIAVLVHLLFRSVVNFSGAKSGRVYIAVKVLASLAVWFLASGAWLFMFYVTAYTAAGNGSSTDEARLDAATLLLLDLAYALVGSGLAFWVRHKSAKGR